jgi:hypothetical protein
MTGLLETSPRTSSAQSALSVVFHSFPLGLALPGYARTYSPHWREAA